MSPVSEVSELVSHLLMRPVLIAVGVGVLAYGLSRWATALCKYVALLGSLAVLVTGILALVAKPAALHWTWVAELAEGISLTVDLAATQLGLLVAIGSAAFTLLIVVYSFRDMAGARWEGKFYAYVSWALGGACLVGLAGNLLVVLVGWEIVTLMLFLLVNQGKAGAPAGAAKAYGMLGFADACLLLAVALLITQGGTANLVIPGTPRELAGMGAMGYAVYALLLAAALAKAGAVPLHTWIPGIAEDAPASVMAFLPAALDKLLGIYLVWLVAMRMFAPDPTLQVVLMVLGATTILSAVLMAMVQHNLKRLLSFHAVSQVGYMILGIGTGTPIGVVGGLFHMVNHAMYKCNLFLMSGTVSRAAGSDEIEDMGGLARALPITFGCGLISALAISGVPPLNGFASKWLVYQGTLKVSGTHAGLAVGLVVAAVFGSALTLASFVKVMYSAFLSPAPRGRPAPVARESFFRAAPMVVLAAACVLLGLWPGLVVHDLLGPEVAGAEVADVTLISGGLQTGGLGFWSPTQATGLILLGILLGLLLVWLSTIGKRVRVVRPFLGGEVAAPDDDRFRVPGTHFYRTVADLPLVGPLLAHGERGAMDLYHWAARHGNTFVQLLRSVHTGLLSLYAAWCLVGLTAILLYLFLTAGA